MRIIIFLADIILLIYLITLVFLDSIRITEPPGVLFFIFILALILTNAWYVIRPYHSVIGSTSFLSTFFKRYNLEQEIKLIETQKRFNELKGESSSKS